ncbi:MAG: hypothetical protein FJ291_02640 [Planctomycetes bacterium]|nr:hypothetical protein [Planctomycetota bacterium]
MPTVKTAFSADKPLFDRAERLARDRGIPRSRVFNDALRVYFARLDDAELTARINAACEDGPDPDEKELRRYLNAHYRRLAEHLW